MTTIDSLEIEIKSNSTNASEGIRDLAKALGELKANGTVTTAVKNLKELSGALKGFTDAANATRSIGKVVGALTKLKSIGSVGSIGNSLKKLSESLKTVGNVNVDKVAPQIEKIAEAVAPLSSVKAGGLNSMINGLLKLDKVTKSLDDDTISRFAERIKVLIDVVDPLSQKMSTISQGLRNINTRARTAGTAVRDMGEDINASAMNLSNFINIIQTVVDWLQVAVEKFTEFMAQAIEWDGIAARFGRGFGSEAKETYAWIQRLNEEMGINVQQFMQYSSVYATMLTGFGVANEDATKMALGYTELTYDIWAGYNDIYKSFDEAAEAVKSAISGEVEPIRRAGFTIIESTLQQTATNHGLAISLTTATEAQKSYLRYLTLIDQAHAQSLVGTYAKELNTAEGLMRTFSQQVKSLSQAFGSLFLPILVRVMPYLQAVVELLTEAVHWLAGLFGIEIQPVDWSGINAGSGALDNVTESADAATGALGDAAKAAKELKNATIGIDELNVISPPSPTGGSGGSGGGGGGAGGGGFDDLDIDSLWDDSIFKNIGDQIDRIKEKLEGWLPVIGIVASALAGLGILSLLENFGTALENMNEMNTRIGALKKGLAGLAIITIEAVLVFMLADEYLESGNLLALVGEALATAAGGYLMYRGFGPKGLIMALGVSMIAQLAAITLNLADGGVEMTDPQLWIQAAFTAALGGVAGGFMSYKGIIKMSTGQGIGFGLAAGLSLTLASITIGNVAADGNSLVSLITGAFSSILGGVAGASILTALGVATGGTAFLIGFAVMLAVNIIGAIVASVKGDAKASLEKDMKDRFGSIELEGENLDVYIEKVTAIPREVTIDTNVWNEALEKYEMKTLTVSVDAALEFFSIESNVLESMKENIEAVQTRLDSQNMKIALGVDVSYSDYASSIDTFVNNAQDYLDQYYLTTNIAIDILGSNSSENLSGTLAAFYSTNSTRLAELGKELKQTVADAFEDGEWIPHKLQEAIELQKEIQEILDYTSEIEFRAEMQNLELSISGDMLTADSFKNVLKGAKEAIETRLGELEEVKMSSLQVAVMEYDANIEAGMSEAEAKKIYDMTVEDIQEAYQNGVVEVTYGSVDFGLSTLREAFAKELAEAEEKGWFNYEEKLKLTLDDVSLVVDEVDLGEGEIYTDIQSLLTNMEGLYKMGAENMSAEARKNLEELIEAMTPTMADYEKLAESSRKSGITVLEGVRSGLNDYNELAALTGDTDAINYLIGQQFSTDDTFLNTLATVETAGRYIDKSVGEGLLNNIDYVTAAGSDVIVGVRNSVTGKVTAITPELKQNLSDLGVDMGNALGDEYEYVYNEAGTVIEGVKSSVDNSLSWINPQLEKALEDAGIKVGDAFSGKYDYIYDETGTTIAGIKSAVDDTLLWVNPEVKKATENTGENVADGLTDGVKKKEKGVWDSLGDWVGGIIKKVKEFFGIASPSKEFKTIGEELANGIVSGIQGKAKGVWDSLREWAGGIVDNVKEFFGIASPSKKFKELGGYLTDGLVEGLTDTSAITDPIKDMWNNAKDWLEDRDLNFSFTPTIGSIETEIKKKWESARTWWDKKKTKAKTYTPEIGSIYEKMKSRWDSARTWWNSKKTKAAEYTPSIGSIYDKVYTRWKSARDWWNKKKGSFSTYTPSIGSLTDKLKNAWNSAKKWWSKNVKLDTKLNVKVPTIKVKWETASAFGKSFKYPTGFSLKFAADGGIFDAGSLIWAGERGAEVVANAGGGRTGVMNVSQMQDAVFEGVYAAVMAANRASQGDSGGQSINVYLDGRQITAAVEKRQRERGASIMGKQVYSY